MTSGTSPYPREAIAEMMRGPTAVVIVDMQNDFCAPRGVYAESGLDVTPLREIVAPLARLVDAGRRARVPVVYLQQTTLPNGRSDSPAWQQFKTRGGRRGDYTLAGTWGQRIIDELSPSSEDLVVPKFRSSGFVGTPLELLLGAAGVRTLIVGGCETDGCIASTARDAQVRDYAVVLIEDCVASANRELHRCALTVLRSRFPVLISSQVLAYWAQRGRDA